MELTDGTITLRPPTVEDADELIAAVHESRAELAPWMPWAHAGYGRSDVSTYLALNEQGDASFLVVEATSGRLVGSCGLNHLDGLNLRANLGYWVRTSFAGRGIATRAARLVAWYGHEHLTLHRLEIIVAVGNEASEAVTAKLGAAPEGVLRDRLLLEGRHRDATMHALLPGDTAGWAQRYGLRAVGSPGEGTGGPE